MAHANPPKSTPTNTSLREAIYFYGDLCAHFQAECEFGKASVDKRNENFRLEGDKLLALLTAQTTEARIDELKKLPVFYEWTENGDRFDSQATKHIRQRIAELTSHSEGGA